jgi:hypothetical protein
MNPTAEQMVLPSGYGSPKGKAGMGKRESDAGGRRSVLGRACAPMAARCSAFADHH